MPRLLITAFVFFFYVQISHSQDTDKMFADFVDRLLTPKPFMENGKYGLKIIRDSVIVKPEYEDFGELSPFGLIPAKKNGKWGFINTENKIVVPFKYDKVYAFRGSAAIVKVGNKKMLINTEGRQLTKELYDDIRDIEYVACNYCNLFPVKQNDKWGFLDQKGTLVIPFQYEYASKFNGGLASVRKNDKLGYIDTDNKLIVPFEFDKAFKFIDGSAVVEKNGYSWMINNTGKAITGKYPALSDETDEFVTFQSSESNPKFGKLNRKGREIIPAIYDEFGETVDSITPAKKNGSWGYIHMNNRQITAFKYNDAKNFVDGLARVKKDGKWGGVNLLGKENIPLKYDYINDIEDGLIAAKLNGKVGFINYENETIIPFIYDGIYTILGLDASGFTEGLVCVKKDGRFGYINEKGEVVIPIKYDYAEGFVEGMAVVGKNNKHGYINTSGKEVIEIKYEIALYFVGGIAGVEKNGDKYFIDRTGKKVATPEKNPYDIFGALTEALEEID